MHNVIQQSQTGKKTRGVFWLRLWIGFLIYLMGGFPTLAFALPQDGTVVSGDASIHTSGNDMVVHQTSDKLIANWQSFNIGSGESVEFKQPSAASIALNNVIGLSPSVILGVLKSNGQVFLSNGSGIIFGQGAQVNVGGLLATTLNIKNEDFLAGNYNFTQDPARPLSSVINRGLIEASYVGLLAPGVENTGTIVANLGSVAMASGKAASMDFVGDGLINFAITEAVDGDVLDDEGNVIVHRVKNAGLIQADGGRVVLSARDAGNIIQNVVNNTGIIEAHSAVEKNGEIFLMGGDSGVVANSGTLDASGEESGQTGGTVHMVGEKVGVFGEGVVDVSGNAGGGTALIGGDVQGGGDVQTATNTYVSEDATITADAVENGDGGKVVVWADDTTRVYGSVSATGGALSGDGGFVETSGKNFLEITRAADVTAAFGLGGEWLIDPRDISIEAGNGNTNINSSNPFVSTGDSSILGVDLIIAALTGGANVTITTGSDGTQAGDITLNTDLDFNGTGTNTLSFIAHNDIILNNSILDSSAGGDTLNLVFTADSDLSGSGTLVVGAAASVESQGGSMQVTARDVDIQGTLDAGVGDVTISIAQQVAGTGEIQIGDAAFCPTCAMVITGQELQNITAANLTIENSADAIYLDNITAVNSDNVGTLILDASGNIEFGRDALDQDTSTFNALRVLSDAKVLVRETLETDTGNLEITADADGSGGAFDQLKLQSSVDLISAGDITLDASLSATGRIYSTALTDMTAAGTITFQDEFFGQSIATLNADNGIIINGDFTANAMILNGDANSLADGIDQVVFADGITVDAFGNVGHIVLHKSEALGSITFSSGGGMDLLGDLTANGTVTINADTAVPVGTGLFSIASGVELNTNNNTLFLTTSEIDLQGTINVGSNAATISIAQAGTTKKIYLGEDESCTNCLAISGADLQNITAGTLTIENTAHAIIVNNISAANSDNIGTVILDTEKYVFFKNNASTFNALTVNAKAEVDVRTNLTTDTGDLIINADTDSSGGVDRIFFAVDPTLTSAGDITLNSSSGAAGIDASGSLTLVAGGTISLNDDFTAGNNATLSADNGINVNGNFTAGQSINLDGDANSSADGNDTITFANGITLASTGNAVTLGQSVALGSITLNARDGINLNGDFTSNGATTIDADTGVAFGAGTFTVAIGATLNTNSNTLSINALDIDLQGNINVGSSDVSISIAQPASGNQGQIILGDNTSCPACTMQISGSELQNITAGTLTLDNNTEAIVVDNISAANSDNIGTVILNSARHVGINGNASTFNALTVNAKTDVDVRVNLTTDTGDLILNADTDSTGGVDRIFFAVDPTLTSAGDIILNSSSGAPGIDASGSVTMLAGGTISLNDDFTAGNNATLSADNGINVNGEFTAGQSINLDGDANSSADGNDTITFLSGVTVSAAGGSLTLGQSVALGSITLNARDGIALNGDFTSNGTTTIDADTGVTFGTGTFAVASGATLNTNNNTLSINALDIDLQGAINAGSSDISITVSNNGVISLGNATGGLTLSGSEIQNISAANLFVGTTSNGNVSVDGVSAANSDNIGTVIVNSGGDISFNNNDSVFNALTLNANNDINVNTNLETDTGNFAAVADADLNAAGDFNLGTGTTLTSANDIDVTAENVSLNGNLVAGGTITVNGVVITGGGITIQAVDGISFTNDVFNNGDITIDADTDRNGVGDFEIVAGKIVKSFDNNITITANDFIISGLINAGTGTLTLLSSVAGSTIGLGNATGDIVISGAELQNITASTLNIGSPLLAGAPINSGINVDGVTAADLASIGAVSLNSDGNIEFTGSDSTFTTLDLFAEGSISTTGVTLIGTDLTTVSGTGMSISTQVDSLSFDNFLSGDVTVNNVGALALRGDGAVGGSLFLTTGGDITSTGALRINQAINIDATGFDITLDNSLNFNTGIVSVSGKNVSLADFGSIDLGTSTITGNLIVNVGGNINNSGALSVAGTTNLISNGSVGITLDNAANDFNGTVTAAGANVTLVDSDDITLGASTVTGALSVTAADGITVDGAVTTSGLTSFNADSDGNSNGSFSVTALGSLQTNNNDLSIISRDIDLQGTVDAGAGNVLLGISGAGQVMLGDDASCPTCAMKISGSELQNITAATLTLNNSTEVIFVDNISAANSDNIGTVILTSGRHVAFSGNASTFNALTVNAKTNVDVRVNLTTDTGDLILNADTDSTGGTDRIFFAVDPTLTSAGDITLNSSSGAAGIDASGSVTMLAGGTISLNDDFTAGNDATLSADNGINVNGEFTAGKSINLDGDANSSVDGNDTITFADGVTLTSTSSSVTLGQTVALGSIILNARDGVTLTGDFTSNGTTTIDADTGVTFGTGTFAVASGATLNTNNNTLSINALDIDLQGNVNVGSSNMIISIAQASGTQGQIVLGDNTICPTCAMQISGSELQNITAGTLTIENTEQAIFVDNITAANSDNIGNVILNSEKHIRFLNNVSTFNTLTVNAKAGIDVYAGLTTDTGDLVLNADTDSTGGTDHLFFRFDPTLTSAANIVLSTSGGANIDAEASVTMVAAGTITLSDDFTAGGGATLNANDGINLNGNFTAAGDIVLNGDTNSSVDGNDTITLANGIIVESTTGSISFDSSASALGSITVLAANGIDINDAFASSGSTVFNSDSDANGTGTFTVASTGSLSSSFLVITADDVDLAGTVSATSKVSIRISDGGTIGIGNAVGDMSISGAELQNLTSNVMEIGLTGNSKLTADGVTLADVSNFTSLSLNSAGEIEFAGAASNFNYLTVIADGPINVNAAVSTQNRGSYHSDTDINVNADLESSADISVYSDASIFTAGAKIISAGSMDIRSGVGVNISTETNSLSLRNTGTGDMIVNNSGNLFITVINSGNVHITNTGTVSQGTHPTNSVNVFGTFTVNAAGFDVTLANTTNEFGGTVNIDGANVALVDQNSIDFGTSTITSNLSVTAGGAVTQSDTLTVAGATDINAAGFDVFLDNFSNDFTGAVSVTSANVTLVDTNAIDLGSSTVTGTLDITAGGAVTQSGALSIGATHIDAAGFDITLDNVLNDFKTVYLTGNNVAIADQSWINFGTSTFSGDFTLTTGDYVQQTGTGGITVGGTTMINAAGHLVVLISSNNDFMGEVGINAGLASIFDKNTITLKDSNVTNDFTVIANDGLTVNGAITTSGTTGFNSDSDVNGVGTFTVTAAGSILTNNNTLLIRADDIDLQGTINVGTSDVNVLVNDGGTIGLGNAVGGMTITGSELQNITAANLILGHTTNGVFTTANGDVTVDGITAANSDNIGTVTLQSGANIHFNNSDSVFNALNVHAVTDINVNTNIETDTGSFVAIADFENNTIGDFNLGTGTTVTSALDIDITAENVNLNGNLDAGGTITINGEIFADDPIFLYAVDGIIITDDINNNESITIDADTNRDGIGDFELVGGVIIKSNGYDISITANDFIIDGIIDAGLGNVTLISSVGGTIGVGEAWGNIRIDNSELQNITAGNLIIGDENNSNVYVKNVQAVDVANISELTLNATKWGKSVIFYGPASNLNDLTANASNDVRVYGGLTAKDTAFNAGDDVRLWGGTYTFDSLTAVAGDDVIIYGTLNTVNADYTAGDDIWLDGYQTYTGNLNATAGDDITIDWELTAATATLNAGDDVLIHGTTHFGDLTVNAGDDISVKGNHVTTGTANLTAADDISLKNTMSFNFLNANAGDDIYIDGLLTLTDDAFFDAGDDISVKGSGTIDTVVFTAADDFSLRGVFDTGLFNVHAGDDISIKGTVTAHAMSLNANDDISVDGELSGRDIFPHPSLVGQFNAGDNISLRGTMEFSDLIATAGNNISVYGNVNMLGTSLTATAGDIRLDGYQTYGILNATAGDDISIGWELNATTATLTAGDDVSIKGTTRFGDLTVNATDDISIRGDQQTTGTATLIAGDNINLRDNNSFGALDAQAGNDIHSHGILSVTNDANLSAGDDIHLHGNNSIGGELNASAVDDIHFHGLLAVTGDGNLDAGDDIHLHGNNSFGGDLNADAGDDIHSHGLLAVGNDGSLVAGDDIHLHGNNSFGGDLFAAATGDIRSHGDLAVTGSSFMSAGADIYMNGQFNSGAWTAIAGDDIRLKGDYNLSTADLKANDEIRLDKATVNSGNFSAEADFDNNDAGAFKLDRKSSITSTGDVDLSGYGLKLKGSLNVAGTLTLTDKSAGNLLIHENITAGSFTISSGGNVTINSTGNITINSAITGSLEINTDGEINAQANFNPGTGVVFQSSIVSSPFASFSTVSLGSGITGSLNSASVGLYSVIGNSSPSVIVGLLNFSGNNVILVNNN